MDLVGEVGWVLVVRRRLVAAGGPDRAVVGGVAEATSGPVPAARPRNGTECVAPYSPAERRATDATSASTDNGLIRSSGKRGTSRTPGGSRMSLRQHDIEPADLIIWALFVAVALLVVHLVLRVAGDTGLDDTVYVSFMGVSLGAV